MALRMCWQAIVPIGHEPRQRARMGYGGFETRGAKRAWASRQTWGQMSRKFNRKPPQHWLVGIQISFGGVSFGGPPKVVGCLKQNQPKRGQQKFRRKGWSVVSGQVAIMSCSEGAALGSVQGHLKGKPPLGWRWRVRFSCQLESNWFCLF